MDNIKNLQGYYKSMGLLDNSNKKQKNEELFNLYKKPKVPDSHEIPKFQNYDPRVIHQADILELPNDNGYKYALVVVDIGSRRVNVTPLKSKSSKDVKAGFEKIYKSIILQMPKKIEVDDGSEFKGEVKKYFDDHNTIVRVAKPGRHSMQAIVERANQTIGEALHKRMTAQELVTGEHSKHWTEDIYKIRDIMNVKAKKNKPMPLQDEPICHGNNCNVLSIGTKVRVKLEKPVDVVTGNKLFGNFRKSDIRWNPEVRVIRQVLIKPGQPPMYLLDGNKGEHKVEPVAYSKHELQVVSPYEKAPPGKEVIRGDPQQYVIQKIHGEKIINNKRHLLIEWKGFPDRDDWTYEPYQNIKEDAPNVVKKYEDKFK